MARRYRVGKGYLWAGMAGGEEIEADGPYNYSALAQAGILEEIEPLVSCPACEADKSVKAKDVPQFKKAETLSEHYEKEHPALAAPDFEEVV